MNKETKLRIHNITAKAVLKFGNEAWVLKKREEQRLEAAQMKFLRHLLGITKLDKEKNQCTKVIQKVSTVCAYLSRILETVPLHVCSDFLYQLRSHRHHFVKFVLCLCLFLCVKHV